MQSETPGLHALGILFLNESIKCSQNGSSAVKNKFQNSPGPLLNRKSRSRQKALEPTRKMTSNVINFMSKLTRASRTISVRFISENLNATSRIRALGLLFALLGNHVELSNPENRLYCEDNCQKLDMFFLKRNDRLESILSSIN